MSDITYELAKDYTPQSIAKASQVALLNSMQKIFKKMEKDIKQPGLTWEQLDFFLNEMKNKDPEIVIQEHEL